MKEAEHKKILKLVTEFEITNKKETQTVKGYVILEDIDEIESVHYYNHQGFENGTNYPNNPYNENTDYEKYHEYENLKNNYMQDLMFLQYIADFAETKKVINRGDYIIKINM